MTTRREMARKSALAAQRPCVLCGKPEWVHFQVASARNGEKHMFVRAVPATGSYPFQRNQQGPKVG